MNKQIKDLVKQAGGIGHDDDGDELTPMLVGSGLEKFAELIVRECAKAAYKYASDSENYEHYDDIGWDCLPGDLKSHIVEHFGVEE